MFLNEFKFFRSNFSQEFILIYVFFFFFVFFFCFQTIRCFEQSKMNKTSLENKLGLGNAKNHSSRIKAFSVIEGLKYSYLKDTRLDLLLCLLIYSVYCLVGLEQLQH